MANSKTPLLTAQWNKLVLEAEEAIQIHLDEDLESYLVFLLMRFHSRPEIARSVMALEYLEGLQSSGQIRREQLRSVGDQCLLYSGLFPQRARRNQVTVGYYIDLGRSAYRNLAEDERFAFAEIFTKLAIHFVSLMDTLQALRSLGTETPLLDPLTAAELWQESGSRHARAVLGSVTTADLLPQPPTSAPKH